MSSLSGRAVRRCSFFLRYSSLSGLLAVVLGLCGVADAREQPHWIWSPASREAGQSVCLRGQFTLDAPLKRAQLHAAVDFCHAALFINGTRVALHEPYRQPILIDVTEHVQQGPNTIGLSCQSVDGPAAIAVLLTLDYADGKRTVVPSERSWQAATHSAGLRQWPKLDAPAWKPVASLGRVEAFAYRQAANAITISPVDDYTQWKRALETKSGTDAESLELLPGFEATLIRSAADDEDSWVSLAQDAKGRWIIGQEKKGLLRLTVAQTTGEPTKVERVNDSLAECRGLLFAFDSLYTMANNDKALYRLRDTTGDDRFDKIERLSEFGGTVGHGRNQLTLGPDGKIYAIFGDAVVEPQTAKRVPPNLARPDRHEKTQNGFVARTDAKGRDWEVVVRGLRNPYGIDFNTDGEMFTYDADAEYDMGAPWYRPTRIDHLVPAGDFGWRRVTKQWPPYVPDRADMPQPTLDIGKGSPTAVEFGTDSNFPPRYRNALYALDWAYGRILAVHMTPRGASYAAGAETFVRGAPLNVTDVEFGQDGAMYFTTGGRGTQSALYRVAYVGERISPPSLAPQQQARIEHAGNSRRLRKRLEAFSGRPDDSAVSIAWPHLASSDPWIRHAARAAVESQPIESWRPRALQETDTRALPAGLLALSRVDPATEPTTILDRLRQLSGEELSERGKLEVLFLIQRCLADEARLTDADRNALFAELLPFYPDESPRVNNRLSLILSRQGGSHFVQRTMTLLEQTDAQARQLHYLFVLRNVTAGWTPALRQRYFTLLRRTNEFIGGDGLPTFRKLIQDEALAAIPKAERAKFAALLETDQSDPYQLGPIDPNRKLVRKWTADDLSDVSQALANGRNFEQAKQTFSEARCIACHRIGRTGGTSGPDLTALASRFTPRDILTSILDPSRVVSEKYTNDALVLKSGKVVVGRIVPGDYRSPELRLIPELLNPDKIVTISKNEIEARKPSPISAMPTGLLDTFQREEILDLLAYLIAAGDSRHPAFRR